MAECNELPGRGSDKPLVLVLLAILVGYGVAIWTGWTLPPADRTLHASDRSVVAPSYWAVIPFVLMLAAIAIGPLVSATKQWWDVNPHKFYVAGSLALATLLYLVFGHPTGDSQYAARVAHHAVFEEYVPFIVLLFSLYTICGGIRIQGDVPAHALTNSTFIAAGALSASLIGTTGAAMLLIRPLLETNAERKQVTHTVVFFIFIVCNCGGLLLPLGDPPLFLGYLEGVPFLWTLSLWRSWLFVNALLIAIYFCWDHFICYPRKARADIARDESDVRPLVFRGLWPNVLLLVGIVAAVGLLDPGRTVPGTTWRPWPYLREAIQLGLVVISLVFGQRRVREDNRFDYRAIVEVAVLFFGIFICMQPALDLVRLKGASFGLQTPAAFFWTTGWLSSLLDNAPTYLVFFRTAQALPADTETIAGVAVPLLRAISIASVMMGAMTYIGNGPNFMVKSIAESAGVRMPSFFGFLVYSGCVLLPVLAINAWLFL